MYHSVTVCNATSWILLARCKLPHTLIDVSVHTHAPISMDTSCELCVYMCMYYIHSCTSRLWLGAESNKVNTHTHGFFYDALSKNVSK